MRHVASAQKVTRSSIRPCFAVSPPPSYGIVYFYTLFIFVWNTKKALSRELREYSSRSLSTSFLYKFLYKIKSSFLRMRPPWKFLTLLRGGNRTEGESSFFLVKCVSIRLQKNQLRSTYSYVWRSVFFQNTRTLYVRAYFWELVARRKLTIVNTYVCGTSGT